MYWKSAQICVLAAAFGVAAPAQVTKLDLRTQGRNPDFSQATATKPAKAGTVLPATCTVGEVFLKTDATPAAALYACLSLNTWTVQGGGGGGSAPGGADTHVQFNNAGSLGGNAEFAWNSGNRLLTVSRTNAGGAGGTIRAQNGDNTDTTGNSGQVDVCRKTSLCSSFIHSMANVDGAGALPWSYLTHEGSGSGQAWAASRSGRVYFGINAAAGKGTFGGTIFLATEAGGQPNTVTIAAGQSQGSNNLTQWTSNAGAVLSAIDSSGNFTGLGRSAVQNGGAGVAQRSTLNFVPGTGFTWAISDSVANGRVDIQPNLDTAYLNANYARLGTANNFLAGQKATLTHDGTNAGFRLGPAAGDPATLANGDCWYNATLNRFRCYENGTAANMIGGGGGGGDVSSNTATSVDSEVALFSGTGGKTVKRAAGSGVARLTSGVLGVVSGTASDCVKVDGSSGACGGAGSGDFSSNTGTSVDGEVLLFSGTGGKTGKRATGSGIAKLVSGVLSTATAGTDYTTPSSTESPTNKNLDCEASGNTCTIPVVMPLVAARCQAGSAFPSFSTAALNAPSAACVDTGERAGGRPAVCGGGFLAAVRAGSFPAALGLDGGD